MVDKFAESVIIFLLTIMKTASILAQSVIWAYPYHPL